MLGFSPESGRALHVLMITAESLVPWKVLEVLTQQNALNLTSSHLSPLVPMHGEKQIVPFANSLYMGLGVLLLVKSSYIFSKKYLKFGMNFYILLVFNFDSSTLVLRTGQYE